MALGRPNCSSSISLHNKGGNRLKRSQCWRSLGLLPFLAAVCAAAATQHQHKSTSIIATTTTSTKEAWTLPAFVPRQQQDATSFSVTHKSLVYKSLSSSSSSSSVCLNEFLLRFRGGSSDRNGGGYYNSNDYYQREQPGQAGSAAAAAPPPPPSKGYDAYGRYQQGDYRQGDGGGDDGDDKDDGYYNEDYDYDDRGLDRPTRNRSRDKTSSATGNNMGSMMDSILPTIIKTGDRRIGFMLLSGGAILTMLGISLFFNKALLRMGNLLFIAGVPMTLGPSRTAGYFLQAQKLRATVCLGFGIFLVLIGSPVLGMCLEIFGLLNLFGNMFPVLLAIAKQMPIIGPILSGGGGGGDSRRNNNNNSRQGNNNRRRQDEDDYYYQDDEQSYYNEGDGWRDDGGSGDRYY